MPPYLSNWSKEAQIIFRRVFQKDCTTIHYLISYLFTFQFTSIVFEDMCGVECERLIVSLSNHSLFSLIFRFFYIRIMHQVGFYSSFRFCKQSLNLMRFHFFFVAHMVGRGRRPCMMLCEILL
jgi:hypothetical protein